MNKMFVPLQKYAEFTGRAGRAEFWLYCLFIFAVNAIARAVAGGMGATTISSGTDLGSMTAVTSMYSGPGGMVLVLLSLFSLATLIPSIAVSVRRLHDTDRSGWWVLLWLIPVLGWLVLLIFYLLPGTPGDNRHGPVPA